MDIVHVCIQYSNLQNIAKYMYWFHVPTMTKFNIFARFISLTLYIRCMKVKLIVHTRIHCITSSQVKCFFICLCSPSVCWENKQIENISTWGKCSIHNADIYIVYSPFGESENREIFFLLKIWFIFFSFLYRYFILYTKLEQIFTDFFYSK